MGVEAATLRAQPTTSRRPTTVARAAPIVYATPPYPFYLQNPLSQSQPHVCYSSLGKLCYAPPQRLQPVLYDTYMLCPSHLTMQPSLLSRIDTIWVAFCAFRSLSLIRSLLFPNLWFIARISVLIWISKANSSPVNNARMPK